MAEKLTEKLALVSSKPGVYQMKDASGRIIYVEKAKNLKKRLNSYFNNPGRRDVKTGVLVSRISDFEVIITASENEALILESNLIKRHKPKYNVILKDDKQYPFIRLDVNDPFPYISVVRKIKKDGARYFGPYTSSLAMRQTLKLINKTFSLRKCSQSVFRNRTRPCLNYQINACPGPCCLDVDKKAYSKNVNEVILLLSGKTQVLMKKIRKEMFSAAEAEEFEQAARLRDKLFALEKVTEKQVIVSSDQTDRDVLALKRTFGLSLFTVLFIRSGALVGSRHFEFRETIAEDEALISTFVRQYYEKHFIPRQILIPVPIDEAAVHEDMLKVIKNGAVKIVCPVRGDKKNLVDMAAQNAEKELKNRIDQAFRDKDLLEKLRSRIGMETLPERIECADNSNISGTEAVASIVVFQNGKPEKSLYRTYKIKTVEGHDDYAYMNEVLRRRFEKGDDEMPFPDIFMVDGGKGQLNIAVSVLRDLGLENEFSVIGIAKKDEEKGETEDKIYKPGRANPVNFGRDGDALFLLQRVRDEAHRFAVTFHRKRRSKKSVESVFDTVPGIGKKRKSMLLKHFKSVKKIKEASVEQISALPGISQSAAEAVKEALNK